MSSEAQSKKATYQSLLSLLALAVASAAVIWGVKQVYPSAVGIVATLVSIAVMGCSVLLARRVQRTLDEVQIASQSAANYKGTALGGMIALALLMLPPVAHGLAELVYMLVKATPDMKDLTAMRVGLVFGAVTVMVVQTFVTMIAAAIWWRRAGGAGEA